jgi:hypothetical protein
MALSSVDSIKTYPGQCTEYFPNSGSRADSFNIQAGTSAYIKLKVATTMYTTSHPRVCTQGFFAMVQGGQRSISFAVTHPVESCAQLMDSSEKITGALQFSENSVLYRDNVGPGAPICSALDSEKFLGFKLQIKLQIGSAVHFGWLRIGLYGLKGATIKDLALNKVAGQEIKCGQK